MPLTRRSSAQTVALACLVVPAAIGYAQPTSTYWTQYLAAKTAGTEPTVSDFSWSGYRGGNEAIPTVNHTVFDVTAYGAVPNDHASDRDAFQAAIDAAEANGSGIVFFPPGRYHLNTAADAGTPILIQGSNIVVRGSGMKAGGTELFMERNLEPTDPESLQSTPFMIEVRPLSLSDGTLTTVTADAPRMSYELQVASTTSITVGQRITLYMLNPLAAGDFLSPYVPDPLWTDLSNPGINVREIHTVAAKTATTITLREPLQHAIESSYNYSVRRNVGLEEVGFEDLALVGNWTGDFVHHRSPLDDGGWSGLKWLRVSNGWIRRVRFDNWNWCFFADTCSWSSMLSTQSNGVRGHLWYQSRRGYGMLFGLSEDNASHFHGPSVGYQNTCNVSWRVKYPGDTSWDSHGSQPYATLLDRSQGGMMYGRSGGSQSDLPNHLRGFTLWNHQQTGTAVSNYNFWRSGSNTRDRFVLPLVVGFHGSASTFNVASLQGIESLGTMVAPESLYEAQIEHRLGAPPPWIASAKREWDLIKAGAATTLATPAANAVIAPGTTLNLSATVSQLAVGEVENVEFLHGLNTSLGTDTASPWEGSWPSIPAGTWELRARTRGSVAGLMTSLPVVVYAGLLPQPQLSLPAPTVSSEQAPNVGGNVLDGDLNTRWSAQGVGQWIAFDLGAVVPVNRADIAWHQGNTRQALFAIEVSTDGTYWRRVLDTRSSGTTTASETHYFPGGPARHVRVVGLGNTINDWNSITELRLLQPVVASDHLAVR